MISSNTKEPQYNDAVSLYTLNGAAKMGFMSSFVWRNDPRRLCFMLSRYKFVSKMLHGFSRVLEIGCGDGFGSSLLKGEVGKLVCSDFDPLFIEECKKNKENDSVEFIVIDYTLEHIAEKFDGVYALDVFEHIDKTKEYIFMKNIVASLNKNGVAIIGIPSLESQEYASKESKEGHVNCKNGDELKEFLKIFFENVFVFSMNDEVIHTGYYPMAHYLMAVCCQPKI